MAIPFTLSAGSQSLTSGVEFFLVSANTTAAYQTIAGKATGFIDLSAWISGDQCQITPYEKVNGGAVLPAAPPSFPTGVQSSHFKIPEQWVNEGWEIGVKLLSATARTIGWSVKIDVGDRNLLTWKGASPAALTTNGYVQSALLRWLTDNAAGTPAALSSSGFVQAMLLRWLTDDAAGTPSALATNKVQGDAPSAATVASTLLATALEGSKTVAQVLRAIVRLAVSKKRGYDTGTVIVRDMADTKDSMTLVTDATGVTTATYTDLT